MFLKSIAALLLGFVSLGVLANEQWKTELDRRNVVVKSKTHESGYKEVFSKTTVNADVTALYHLLQDIENATAWIHNSREILLIEQPNRLVSQVHSKFNAPWPVEDRDMVTQSITQYDASENQLTIEVSSVNYPETPAYIRMLNVKGVWKVVSLNDEEVEISYQGTANPSGELPQWLANKVLISSSYKTFLKLRRQIIKTKYQNKPLAYVN